MNMKKWILPLLVILCIVLSGCSEDGTSADEIDLSGYPSSVQDGTVSVEYYNQIVKYATQSEEYQTQLTLLTKMVLTDGSIINEKKFKEDAARVVKNYDEFLYSFDVDPVTKAEKRIDSVFKSLRWKDSEINQKCSIYYSTANASDAETAYNTIEDSTSTRKIFINTADIYGIFE